MFFRVFYIEGACDLFLCRQLAADRRHEVIHVAKRSGLTSISVDRERLIAEGLNDKIRDDSTIVEVHSRAIGVENSGNLDLHLILAMVVKKECFGASLPF